MNGTFFSTTCVYCDTEFSVQTENEDDVVVHCPFCGEELLEEDEPEQLDLWNDDEL